MSKIGPKPSRPLTPARPCRPRPVSSRSSIPENWRSVRRIPPRSRSILRSRRSNPTPSRPRQSGHGRPWRPSPRAGSSRKSTRLGGAPHAAGQQRASRRRDLRRRRCASAQPLPASENPKSTNPAPGRFRVRSPAVETRPGTRRSCSQSSRRAARRGAGRDCPDFLAHARPVEFARLHHDLETSPTPLPRRPKKKWGERRPMTDLRSWSNRPRPRFRALWSSGFEFEREPRHLRRSL